MQPAQAHERSACTVMVSQSVSAVRVRDVNLNIHQIGEIVGAERLHVLIFNNRVIVGMQIRC